MPPLLGSRGASAVPHNGRVTTPRIAMPVRLSPAEGADARVALANAIFDDVAALVRAQGLEVVVVQEPSLDGFDGLVLPGGGDVDPARYSGDASAPCYDVNPAQDDLDLAIAAEAMRRGIPVLGVCRGLQVLNVAHGGTLVEDLPLADAAPSAPAQQTPPTQPTTEPGPRHRPLTGDGCGLEWSWHPVALAEGSRLRVHLGEREIAVASGHHQAIRRVGEGLVVTATAADGVIEAVEHASAPIVAVQWHPEAAGTPADLAAAPFAVFARLVRGA